MRDDGDVRLFANDLLMLSFTPVLRWRDALLRVIGIGLPTHVIVEVSVRRFGVVDGFPYVDVSSVYLGNTQGDLRRGIYNFTQCGTSLAPPGCWCKRRKGHDGPCVALPLREARERFFGFEFGLDP